MGIQPTLICAFCKFMIPLSPDEADMATCELGLLDEPTLVFTGVIDCDKFEEYIFDEK